MISSLQIHHFQRLAGQILRPPQIGIVGSYHGGNLGDMALGISVKSILEDMGLRGGLQSIFSLGTMPWPKTNYTIVGGGAVGYSDSLIKLKTKANIDRYNTLAFLGVDFNEANYNDDILLMLKRAAWVSSRNEFQADKLKALTGREDITFHPDLVFSYKRDACKQFRESKKKKKLLVNVVPLYGRFIENKWIPEDSYKKERPELFASYDTMIKSYSEGIRLLVESHLKKGYDIETIPFTPEDEDAAKILLNNLPVRHNAYTDNVDKMLSIIGPAKRVFATRYHATILGIKTGAEIIPMAYAIKNEKLLNELGFESNRFLSSFDLAKGTFIFPTALTVDSNSVAKWEDESAAGIKNCIKKLLASDSR